jgi:hypothetical protein
LIPPNPTQTPPNPNPTGYKVIVTLNMNQVYEGEKVFCSAQIQPTQPAGVSINWRQDPLEPAGIFLPSSGAQVSWKAPTGIQRACTFSLIASFTLMGRTYEGSSTIVVLPQNSPPQQPPSIVVNWPDREVVVGSGTLLTIIGSVSQGTNPLRELQVLDSDGSLLQRWPISSSGAFRADLSSFGSPGRKVLRLRILDSVGLYSEQTITVTNDETVLDAQAWEFLKKYCTDAGSRTIRFGNLQTGPYAMPVEIWLFQGVEPYQNLVESAAQFWTKYTGIQFKILRHDQHPSGDVYITICDRFSEDPGRTADTERSFSTDTHEVVYVRVNLYTGWLDEPNEMKRVIMCHEVGHGILTMSHIDEFGPLFIMSSAGDAGGSERVIPPIVQHAIKLLYTHQPGWQP